MPQKARSVKSPAQSAVSGKTGSFKEGIWVKDRCSSIGRGAVLRNLWRFGRHPRIAAKLAALQAQKIFFNQLSRGYRQGCGGKVLQLSLRLTDLCNLRCTTCGQWGEGGFLRDKDLKELKKQEVPLGRYLEQIADLVHYGHGPFLYLWGGEPMLYEGVLDLIESATAMGLPVSIATNGTRIASCAARLARAPLFLLQVSIDGPTEELHNSIRKGAGRCNSFAEIKAGLAEVNRERRSQKNNLPLIASLTTISRANLNNLADIYEAFREHVDLFVFYLSWWIDQDHADAHEKDFARRFGFAPSLHRGWIGDWKLKEYGVLDQQLRELRARSRPMSFPPVILIPNISGEENLRRYYTDHSCRFGFDRCISIYNAAEVNSNGDLSPCRDFHDYVVGNIKRSSLIELWNSPAYLRFRQSIVTEGLMPVCSRCCGLMGY